MSGTEHASGWNPDTQGLTVGEWCRNHGLFRPIIPFAFQSVDPLRRLVAYRETIDSLAPTAATFTIRDARRVSGVEKLGHYEYSRMLPRVLGAWLTQKTSSMTRYANPQYVHFDSLPAAGDCDDITTWAREAACIGSISLEEVAVQTGVSTSTVQNHLGKHGETFTDLRAEGRRTMGQTMATINAWGVEVADLAYAVGMPRKTASEWVNDALRDGFRPPVDPTATYIHDFERYRPEDYDE